jgi:hypothetical protein
MPQGPSQALPVSAAGMQLGIGDLLQTQREDETERLKRLRQSQLAGRPELAGLGTGLGVGDSVLGPMSAFAGRLR